MTERALRPCAVNTSYCEAQPASPSPPRTARKHISKATKNRILKSHSPIKKTRSKAKIPSNLQSSLPRDPYFAPFIHTRPVHKAQNRLPPSITDLDVIIPHHIFDLFFSDDILQRMTYNTNLYAAEKRKKKPGQEASMLAGHTWFPITIGELRCWFGIIIYMGVIQEPSVSDY